MSILGTGGYHRRKEELRMRDLVEHLSTGLPLDFPEEGRTGPALLDAANDNVPTGATGTVGA